MKNIFIKWIDDKGNVREIPVEVRKVSEIKTVKQPKWWLESKERE